MQYQFDALVAWLNRAGLPMRCQPFKQPDLVSQDASGTMASVSTAVRALMTTSKYDSQPQDCTRAGLSLHLRRLNLLPPSDAQLSHALDVLLAPLDADRGVAIINTGLWYGPPLARRVGSETALQMLHRGVASLARAACTRRAWPRLIWREHTPQHFAGGGEYNATSLAASSSCRPLAPREATNMYKRVSKPVLRAIRAAADEHGMCHRTLAVLPTFWPLVPRWRDHEGFRSQRSLPTGRAKGRA